MTPTKNNGPDAPHIKPTLEETPQAPIVGQQTTDDKRLATLTAALALRGHAVFRATDGGFTVSRWAMHKRCDNLAELEAFAQTVGALQP